ncbi:MAG TPA: hypothetical protein VEH29_10600 [Acidimicrobiales bacterium]|nr:hypothetical protein [Acidimicrobiales bacterium]
MTRLEDQLRQLADTPTLREPQPMEDLERRSARIVRARRRALTAGAVLIVIAAVLVPLPHLHLVHFGSRQPLHQGNQHEIGRQLAELSGKPGEGGFGGAMPVSGNTVVVGSEVFTETVAGWKKTAALRSSDHDPNGCFAVSSAISGPTIVVDDACYADYVGRLYVFSKTASGWEQTTVLKGSDWAAGDRGGFPVAISGNTIVAGDLENNGGSGRAYVFTKTAEGWTQTAELKIPSAAPGYNFAIAVAISGNTAVVGASEAADTAGRAYVFTKTANGWTQTAELKGSDTTGGGGFGSSVAIDGRTVVVGAGLQGLTGRAYVFSKTTSGWLQTAELQGPKGSFGFGAGEEAQGVAVSGTTIVVGAPDQGTGQAYLFTKTGSRWARTELKGSDSKTGDQFGGSVGIANGLAFVGAPNAQTGAGRVYVFNV